MYIKGIKRVDKILNKFLKPFNVTAIQGRDFAYYPNRSEITYAFEVSAHQESAFKIFVKELAPDISCDIFLLSFLHELGHHEVGDEYADEYPFSYVRAEYNRLAKAAFGLTPEETFSYDMEYFNLPWEKGATEWALNYMREHSSEISVLWKKLSKAIQRVYKLNNIS